MPAPIADFLTVNLRDMLDRVRENSATEHDAAIITSALRICHRALSSTDPDSTFYEAQSPVEDWVMSAMSGLLYNHPDHVDALFDRFWEARWDEPNTDGPAPDPSRFALIWSEDHAAGEHDTPDPNCIACPLDGFLDVIL